MAGAWRARYRRISFSVARFTCSVAARSADKPVAVHVGMMLSRVMHFVMTARWRGRDAPMGLAPALGSIR
jgi:hypothetical protein